MSITNSEVTIIGEEVDATSVAAAGAVMETDTSTASMQFVIDEDNMASDSATKVPTQQSVKAYVDATASGIANVVEDVTPQLGGNLDLNGFVITGLVIGTNVQAYDADLTTWAGLTPSANAQSLVTAANYAAMRTLLDLEAGTDFLSPAAIAAAYQPLDGDLTTIAAANNSAVLAATTEAFMTADGTKLDGIETGADVTDATNVAAAGAAMLAVADQVITGGARITTNDLGNLSGNTITPDPGDRPIQKITNNGAGTIAPGTNQGCYLLVVKNTAGAGAITTSGWQDVSGEAFDTTTTSEFLCHCTVVGDFTAMVINKVA